MKGLGMNKVKAFIERNPVRVAAFVSSAVALVLPLVASSMPVDQAVIFILAALGLGEFAQRVENQKTEQASTKTARKK